MKLNFWQWLGLILLVVGVSMWVYKRTASDRQSSTTAPATQR